MPEIVRPMDPVERNAWRLVNKDARDAVDCITTTLSPNASALEDAAVVDSITALPLPLLNGMQQCTRLSCSGLHCLATIADLPLQLQALDISGTKVRDFTPLLRCTTLVQLSAATMNCPLIFRRVGAVLQRLPSLQRLDLSNNIKQGQCLPAMRNLAAALPHLSGLEQLIFTHNHLDDDSAATLAPALYRLTRLQYLDLQDNCIGGEGAVALAPALLQLTGLWQLHLGGNRMGTQGTEALALVMKRVAELQEMMPAEAKDEHLASPPGWWISRGEAARREMREEKRQKTEREREEREREERGREERRRKTEREWEEKKREEKRRHEVLWISEHGPEKESVLQSRTAYKRRWQETDDLQQQLHSHEAPREVSASAALRRPQLELDRLQPLKLGVVGSQAATEPRQLEVRVDETDTEEGDAALTPPVEPRLSARSERLSDEAREPTAALPEPWGGATSTTNLAQL